MNKFRLSIIGICVASAVAAQTVTVKKQGEKVRNEQADGYSTELEGKREDVNASWNKFLKDFGKTKSAGEFVSIAEPAIGGTVYTKGILYASTTGTDEKAKVWIGLLRDEWVVNDIEIVNKELEQLVYRFGIKFYKDKIQVQIDDSQQAADAVDRQTQRLFNENKSLNNKLSNNEQEKIRLEKSLEENKLEHLVLLQKIENNKKAQDSVAMAAVKIKKVVELHKERQKKVN